MEHLVTDEFAEHLVQQNRYCASQFENELKKARQIVRFDIKKILSKLDYDEWISTIFLIFDETNAFAEGFKNISEIGYNKIDKVASSIWQTLSSGPNYETAFDPLIEVFYHIGRYDILEDDLGLCKEHNLQEVCERMNSLFPENLALYQVFSSLTQEATDRLVSLRLKNWHSHHPNEMFEIKFLRNFDSKRKTYLDLITDIYHALMEEGLEPLASLLQPFIWERSALQVGVRPGSEDFDPTEYYPLPQGEPHGLCVIINVKDFQEPVNGDDDLNLELRRGSDIDVDLVEGTFKLFGFTVVILNNPDSEKFFNFFTKLRKDMRMYAMASLAVFVMTHGDRNDNLFLSDREHIPVTQLRKLCYARALIGKPKMFFIQACRGEENLSPVLLQRDTTVTSNTESDCIICEATVGNHSAMRRQSSGSWYINDLCSTLQEIGHRKPLKTVLNATRSKLMERVDKFKGVYITQISEDKVTLTKEIQLKRGTDDYFTEGVLDLTLIKVFLDVIDCLVSDLVDEEADLRSPLWDKMLALWC